MADRHQFRAKWHDYNEGIYFITICCANHIQYFGSIRDDRMALTQAGEIAVSCIEAIPQHFVDAEVWNYVVMPNHLHIVIAVGPRHGASARQKPPGATINLGCLKPKQHGALLGQDFHHNARLAVIINQLKSTIKRETNKQAIDFSWQERFYDNIIQNQHAYERIMYYIDTNVENWCYDRFNENRIEKTDEI